jgi:hypothetical protein
MQLSNKAVRKIKPTDKPQRIFDAGGLYLEVSPVGGKWRRLKYRFTGKEKRLSISVYPDTGLADARAQRDEARKLLARGVDPGVERKATKTARKEGAANSFEVIAREWLEVKAPEWTSKQDKGSAAEPRLSLDRQIAHRRNRCGRDPPTAGTNYQTGPSGAGPSPAISIKPGNQVRRSAAGSGHRRPRE